MLDTIKCPNCNSTQKLKVQLNPNSTQLYRGKCSQCGQMIRFQIDSSNAGLLEKDSIQFTINDVPYTINNNYPINMALNEFLRNVLNMKGTKVMCHEGGCGSCVVNGYVFDYTTQLYKNVSVNSCLFPLYACDGWKFTTVEGVGNRAKGYHQIQKRLADYNGSQCGFCSPGMVMNMYSLLLNNQTPTKPQIENSFDGHICRCTGYRPILDAMKSFAIDETPIDIEDLNKLHCLDINDSCRNGKNKKVHIISDSIEWFQPKSLDELYSLLDEYKFEKYRLVGGNTSQGVYKNDGPFSVFINTQKVPELYQVTSTSSSLTIGANVTLSSLIEIFDLTSSVTGFEYLATLSDHIRKIANLSVRNTATWSGNLGVKYNHPDFPSDVFICFETVGAILTVSSYDQTSSQMSISNFLNYDMTGKFISSVNFPVYDKTNTFIKLFKVMPRSQNAHAYVNAGFRFKIDSTTYIVKETPSIVYGGISPTFRHATKTEQFLYNKQLNNLNVIQSAIKTMSAEVQPNPDPVLASVDYRKSLAMSLLYKFVLGVCDSVVDPKFKSATTSVIDSRPLSQGQQSFPTTPSMYPVTQPMTKLNAYAQTAGEAAYVFDLPSLPNQLIGIFIQTTVGNAKIDNIDISKAVNMPGVVKILLARDIPGINNFMPVPSYPEPVFCDGQVLYAGQSVGLVVAQSFKQGKDAAQMVNITYKEVQKPILTIFDAIQANSFYPKPCDDLVVGNAEAAIAAAPYKIQGTCSFDTQFHFYMELQNAICSPTEDGFEIEASSQWLDFIQTSAAQVLGLPNASFITVKTKQLGGAYGGKITRSNLVACAAALASSATNRPVRVALDLNTNMEMVGKRFPWYASYTVGVDGTGKLLGIKIDYYSDAGASPNDNSMRAIYEFCDNVYSCANWHLSANLAKTNTPTNTPCRSPGTFPCISIMEHIIEQVAKDLNLDVLQVRLANLYEKGQVTPGGQPLPYFNVDEIVNNLISSSDYQKRVNDINVFNQQNRWKKRGISLVPLKWGAGWNGAFYNTFVAIYSKDGSVAVTHGGVESGQGINTKVAQVCAYELNIPISKICIKNPDTIIVANSLTTGGSTTSELVSQGIIQCCKIINANLEPVRKLMPPNYTWEDLIGKAFSMGVDLCARYWLYATTPTPLAYNVYGAAVSEAIIDVLTGETQILRTDILYDCGQTMNGEIDVGQAEGAFVMGLGFWLFEKIRYDPDSGQCLTNGTWEYKPPTTKDIPADLRITFLKNNPNPLGVLGSKCVGEPPLCLSLSCIFAVKRAIEAARKEINQDKFFVLDAPATVDIVQRSCLVDSSQFTFN